MGARVLASKLLHFVPLTDVFIMLDAKLLEPRFLLIIIGTFEKRDPAPLTRPAKFPTKCISNHDLRHHGPLIMNLFNCTINFVWKGYFFTTITY